MNTRALALPQPLADLRRRAAAWWATLAPRDRRMLRAGAVLVGLVRFLIVGVQPALEVRTQVAPHRATHAGGAQRGPKHRHRCRGEQGVEVADAHGLESAGFDAMKAISAERMASSTDMLIGVVQLRGTNTV